MESRALAELAKDFESGQEKLRQFGGARNRVTDRVVRQVVLTDDEAIAILGRLNELKR